MDNFRIVPKLLLDFTDDSNKAFELQEEVYSIDLFGLRLYPTWVMVKRSFSIAPLEEIKKHLEDKE